LALTKERKNEVVSQYETWLKESEAVVLTEYTGLTMPQIDELRGEIRKAGGEFHVIKNTLGKRAFAAAGLEAPDDYFIGSTAIGIAFEDPPGIAKIIKDYGKQHEVVQIKGGFIGKELMSADELKALAELPPLPVVRAQLLGVISAPASKLVRTIAEPGRSLAQVIKAHADAMPA
jgi:large subunit ribosomal protein L10